MTAHARPADAGSSYIPVVGATRMKKVMSKQHAVRKSWKNILRSEDASRGLIHITEDYQFIELHV